MDVVAVTMVAEMAAVMEAEIMVEATAAAIWVVVIFKLHRCAPC